MCDNAGGCDSRRPCSSRALTRSAVQQVGTTGHVLSCVTRAAGVLFVEHTVDISICWSHRYATIVFALVLHLCVSKCACVAYGHGR